jgi:hypothetical protein
MSNSAAVKKPFALRYHENAICEAEHLLGNPNLKWTWEPKGELKPDSVKIYATNGNSTSQRSYGNTWDHGEFS